MTSLSRSFIFNCLLIFVTLLLAFHTNSPLAAECRKTGTTCSQPGGTRTINGTQVYRDCWQYTDSYQCVDPNTIDYCNAIANYPGCYQTYSVCSETAFNGTCLRYTKKYQCGNNPGTPAGTIKLDDTHTITADTIDRSQCDQIANNNSCQLSENKCIEPGGTRVINGMSVYKDCWKYQESYTCIVQDYRDYCTPLRQHGCKVVSQTCVSQAWNGTCNEYKNVFRCDNKEADPLPATVVHVDTAYTVTNDHPDMSQCQDFANNPNCKIASHTCVQPGGTRNINGLNVYKDCWEWKDDYVCASTTLVSECKDLASNPKCAEIGATCLDKLPGGQCGMLEHTYKCEVSPGGSHDVTTCKKTNCTFGVCPDDVPGDKDFGSTVTALELAREAGVYLDEKTMTLFNGKALSCDNKLGGMANCCKAKGGAESQANSVVMFAARAFYRESKAFLGSRYVYDALNNSTLMPDAIFDMIYGGIDGTDLAQYTFGSGSSGMSFYGVSYVPGGTPPFAFDPTSFAIAIAIQIIMNYMQCSTNEMQLGLSKGAKLCYKVGSYCSSKVFGSCVTQSEGYCCFNSILNRIFNEQGRAQIGKTWGTPQKPQCLGFTAEELNQIDFSRMDLSEFVDSVVGNLTVDEGLIADKIKDRVMGNKTGISGPNQGGKVELIKKGKEK